MTRTPLTLVLLATAACSREAPARTFTISSLAMSPTLERGDRVACSRSRPEAPVARGAVVVFDGAGLRWTPEGTTGSTLFVFRVVGLPGESLGSSPDGAVTVDGRALEEPYADGGSPESGPERVPEGHYYVLGDNRGRSADSRVFGPVPHDAVVATCTRIVSPESRRGPIPHTP